MQGVKFIAFLQLIVYREELCPTDDIKSSDYVGWLCSSYVSNVAVNGIDVK